MVSANANAATGDYRGAAENLDRPLKQICPLITKSPNPTQTARAKYVLDLLRIATLRAELYVCELEEFSVALKFDIISPEIAVSLVPELVDIAEEFEAKRSDGGAKCLP